MNLQMKGATMEKSEHGVSYKIYWITWVVLLVLTLVMVFVGYASIPKGVIVAFLLIAMFGKATLISGYFMHLRFERRNLVLTVAVGILFTAAVLFLLIAPDGLRIHELSPR
jgi:caa(3)-type oxidase subunit IV